MGEPPATVDRASLETGARLLRVAEATLLDRGIHVLRTRTLASGAGVNMNMIRYCFGGMDGLVRELLFRNLEAFTVEQDRLRARLPSTPSVRDVLRALLAPTIVPAAMTGCGTAAAVIEDILLHSDERLDRDVERHGWLERGMAPLLAELVRLCPHLSADAVLWRFCCICSGWMDYAPRAPAWRLHLQLTKRLPAVGAAALDELIETATGALGPR